MDLYTLIMLSKAFQYLGDAVQSQLMSVLEGEDLTKQNSNALKMIRDYLTKVNRHVDDEEVSYILEEIDSYLPPKD